jgi:hypothetical protein
MYCCNVSQQQAHGRPFEWGKKHKSSKCQRVRNWRRNKNKQQQHSSQYADIVAWYDSQDWTKPVPPPRQVKPCSAGRQPVRAPATATSSTAVATTAATTTAAATVSKAAPKVESSTAEGAPATTTAATGTTTAATSTTAAATGTTAATAADTTADTGKQNNSGSSSTNSTSGSGVPVWLLAALLHLALELLVRWRTQGKQCVFSLAAQALQWSGDKVNTRASHLWQQARHLWGKFAPTTAATATAADDDDTDGSEDVTSVNTEGDATADTAATDSAAAAGIAAADEPEYSVVPPAAAAAAEQADSRAPLL